MRPRTGEVFVAFLLFCVLAVTLACGAWAAWMRILALLVRP